MISSKRVCIPVSVQGGSAKECMSVLVFVCDSVKCVSVFVCLFVCVLVCVLTCADPDLPKFRDAGLISCGSGAGLQIWTVFLLALPHSLLMGLLRVDALCVGCQKVKVPYSSGTLQSLCRFSAYSDPSVPFCTEGEQAQWEREV